MVVVRFMLLILLSHEPGDIFETCCQLVHLIWFHVLIVVVLNLLDALFEVFVNMLAFILHFLHLLDSFTQRVLDVLAYVLLLNFCLRH